MDFIQTIKSVGGVKPCTRCVRGRIARVPDELGDPPVYDVCSSCHGTGQILDLAPLAPLLASPWYMNECVNLLMKMSPWWGNTWPVNPVIVGPQRASNLVYEVARQLGGTAAVVIWTDWDGRDCWDISLPIPEGATVLFVTDQFDQPEMFNVVEVAKSENKLPYILALVSSFDKMEFPDQEETTWKIISLHQGGL